MYGFEIFFGVIFVLIILIGLVPLVLWAMLFRKLGEKPWKMFVPVLNNYTILRLGLIPKPLALPAAIAIWVVVAGYLGYAALLVTSAYADESLSSLFPDWSVFGFLMLMLLCIIAYFIAVFNITTKRLHQHWAFFLLYLLVGEVVWLAIALVVQVPSDAQPLVDDTTPRATV